MKQLQSLSIFILSIILCLIVSSIESAKEVSEQHQQADHLRAERQLSGNHDSSFLQFITELNPFSASSSATKRPIASYETADPLRHRKSWQRLETVDGLRNEEVAVVVTSTFTRNAEYLRSRWADLYAALYPAVIAASTQTPTQNL